MTKLWSLDEIAEFTSYGMSMARKLVAQPDFPSPVRLFNGAHPRWIAREVSEVHMVPGKPEDFTAAHACFEGQEEGLGDFVPTPINAEGMTDSFDLMVIYATSAGGWSYGLDHIFERIVPDQPPSDGL